MSTTLTVSFTASEGGVVLDGSRHFGPPAELVGGDFWRREPIAWCAASEFLANGTTSGTVTVTAA